jgi:hypothetical protein
MRYLFKTQGEKANLEKLANILKQLPDGIVIASGNKPMFLNSKAYEYLSIPEPKDQIQ